MASQFDPSEFVDSDYQATRRSYAPGQAGIMDKAPSKEEVETRVSETHAKLAELKRAQEELERERATLEELRRRQNEFQTGRQEMLDSLTRGIGLLEQAEFNARRDAEQMAKSLAEFRLALDKVKEINESTWGKENYNVELTRALTVLENARMEWNSARLKFAVLDGTAETPAGVKKVDAVPQLSEMSVHQLARMGLALTWPIVLVGLAIIIILLLRM